MPEEQHNTNNYYTELRINACSYTWYKVNYCIATYSVSIIVAIHAV